jgi:divinyl chlorophyllide a 8-vinyl-reductase
MTTSRNDVVPCRRPLRVFVVGATGYIGKSAVRELVRRGHEVVCLARRSSGVRGATSENATRENLRGATVRFGAVTDRTSLVRDGLCGEHFDAVVSCLATRTGGIADSWLVEHQANLAVLEASKEAGVRHFVLLSAICVQKPTLAFQRAKLAFERTLVESGMSYSIVRPTAFFKSLSGQVERVKRGKPFLVFGDGLRTACKPIGEADLARFMADCLEDPEKQNAILSVGGPGGPITPLEQGAMLFAACGRRPRYRHVPIGLLDGIISILSLLERIFPRLRDKVELARIGRYYATESMLVLDVASGRYDAEATPSYGTDTLRVFYERVVNEGLGGQELGEHAVFQRTPNRPPFGGADRARSLPPR